MALWFDHGLISSCKKGSILDNDDLIHTLNTAKAGRGSRLVPDWPKDATKNMRWVLMNWIWHIILTTGASWCPHSTFLFSDNEVITCLIYPFWIQFWASRQPRSRLEFPWRRLPKLLRPWTIVFFFILKAYPFGHRHGTLNEEVGWCPFFRSNKFDPYPNWNRDESKHDHLY